MYKNKTVNRSTNITKSDWPCWRAAHSWLLSVSVSWSSMTLWPSAHLTDGLFPCKCHTCQPYFWSKSMTKQFILLNAMCFITTSSFLFLTHFPGRLFCIFVVVEEKQQQQQQQQPDMLFVSRYSSFNFFYHIYSSSIFFLLIIFEKEEEKQTGCLCRYVCHFTVFITYISLSYFLLIIFNPLHLIIIMIIIDNFWKALFSGVPKLTALYNILQHFLSFTNIIHIIMTTNKHMCHMRNSNV